MLQLICIFLPSPIRLEFFPGSDARLLQLSRGAAFRLSRCFAKLSRTLLLWSTLSTQQNRVSFSRIQPFFSAKSTFLCFLRVGFRKRSLPFAVAILVLRSWCYKKKTFALKLLNTYNWCVIPDNLL